MVKLCQLLNPTDFVHLNHALSIGSIIPALPIDGQRVGMLNKMIELIWGDDLTIIIPMVVTAAEVGNQRMPNGMTPPKTPVDGLNVRTQQVVVNESDVLEKVVGKVKSDYKYLGPEECMESGCELVLSSILGNLITQPSKSSIHLSKSKDEEGFERPRASRPSSVHSPRHHSRPSSRHRTRESKVSRRPEPHGQKDYMEGNLWSKIKKVLTD